MNTARTLLRQARTLSMIAFGILLAATGSAKAQVAVNTDEFYRQGNHLSDRVSGFLRSIFGSGAPGGQPYSQRTASPLPPSYRQSAPSQAPTRNPSAVQAPMNHSYSTSTRSTASTFKAKPTPKATVPSTPKKPSATSNDAPSYTASSPSPKPRTASSSSSVTKKDESPKGFYTSTSRKSQPTVEDPTTTSTNKNSSTSLTVINAPSPSLDKPATSAGSSGNSGSITSSGASKNSSPSINLSEAVTKSTPPEPAKSTTPKPDAAATAPPSSVNFPTGTVGSKPGRVVSPYPPHTELNVRGLPSGSLAVDPTTQKVFKVP